MEQDGLSGSFSGSLEWKSQNFILVCVLKDKYVPFDHFID